MVNKDYHYQYYDLVHFDNKRRASLTVELHAAVSVSLTYTVAEFLFSY